MRNVIAWSIVGDALGAGYEGCKPFVMGSVGMIGGGFGNFAPYEWTDDTIMMIPLLKHGMDLDAVVADWLEWHDSGPADIGNRTRAVLGSLSTATSQTAASALEASKKNRLYGGGNGTVMRTAPVAFFGDTLAEVYDNACLVAALTHNDPLAIQAAGLWSVLIRQAHDTGTLDLRAALQFVPISWRNRIVTVHPDNGTAVGAVSQAFAAVSRYGARRPHTVLQHIIRQGGDTDTVACIAGGLLGALTRQPPPVSWFNHIHGYPNMGMSDVIALTSSWV